MLLILLVKRASLSIIFMAGFFFVLSLFAVFHHLQLEKRLGIQRLLINDVEIAIRSFEAENGQYPTSIIQIAQSPELKQKQIIGSTIYGRLGTSLTYNYLEGNRFELYSDMPKTLWQKGLHRLVVYTDGQVVTNKLIRY